jgi:hypothetical protein
LVKQSNSTMLKIGLQYIIKHSIVFGLLGLYFTTIVLNAYGFSIWLPECLISKATGYQCFGCGLTTAAMHIARAEFSAAAIANPLIYIYIGGILVWIGQSFYKFTLTQKQHIL